ncbi:MAG: SUMF1/EgtB/PvdO family nonheme iron enzyme, partial [Magnetococcales bacterium]|nr:SUMF1/EgtB/PvdO family nonheme iron enzyme [Magnetococcales bacterium]
YRNWEKKGEGNFGEVYIADDQLLEQKVAIKILREKLVSNVNIVRSLHQEVTISRKLRHEYICPIHDVYNGSQGIGIVMDFIDGMELSEWLKANKRKRLETAAQRLEILKKLTIAFKYAHKHIIHRDIKPSNIILINHDSPENITPIVMDFGTASLGTESEEGQTVDGTPKYMSPEQWETPENVDQRSDIFSLAIMAYEMFTDRIPPTSLRKIFKTKIPPRIALSEIEPPSTYCIAVPSSLDRLIIQMMSYNKEDRPESTNDIYESLKKIELEKVDVASGIFPKNKSEIKTETRDIPGGSFVLGCQNSDGSKNEHPIRTVHLSPFTIGAYPVTVGEYRKFIEKSGHTEPPLMRDPVFGRTNHPIVGVSYEDALAYAKWCGGDLPTEAQWEYTAKGGKNNKYPWGKDDPTQDLAHISSTIESTLPVDSHPKGISSFKIYDMCGNVWEWCKDSWDEKFYSTLKDGCQDPYNNNHEIEDRVIRGGSFDSFVSQGRCTARYHKPKKHKNRSIGFRVVFNKNISKNNNQ